MEIILIRHGATDWNRIQRLQGREDIPLNEEGRRQAHECGRALTGIKVDIILSSPLSRAHETAEIIAGYIGYDREKIVIEDELVERDFGELSGTRFDNIFRSFDDVENVEPLDEVSGRLLNVIRKYERASMGRVLAVTHGGAINALLGTLSDGELGTGKTVLKNAGLNVFECADGAVTLKGYNIDAAEYLSEGRR